MGEMFRGTKQFSQPLGTLVRIAPTLSTTMDVWSRWHVMLFCPTCHVICWPAALLEAVVIPMRSSDPCRSQRLLALLHSAGSQRHVWLLYDTRSAPEDTWMMYELEEAGFRLAVRPEMLVRFGLLSFEGGLG